MKALVIGDIHLSYYSPINYFNNFYSNGVSYNIERALVSMKWVEEVIDKKEIDMVVQVGDVFNTFEYVSKIVTYMAHKSFSSLYKKLKSKNIPFYIVPGNHDIISKGLYLTGVLPCDTHFNKPTVVSLKGTKIHFIPFMDSQEILEGCIINSNADIVFTHTNVKGIAYNKYKQSETGIDVSLIKDKMVISGHIHTPQAVSKNMYLVGSLYQILFHECGDIPQGISIVDSDTGNIERIANNSAIKLKTIYDKQGLEGIDKRYCLIRAITKDKELIQYLFDHKYIYEIIPPKNRANINVEITNIYENINSPVEVIKRYMKDKYMYLYPMVDKYFNT